MADWYISSAAYALVPQWVASHAYSVGNFVRALTFPAFTQQFVFRCTVAGTTGTTEPNWNASAQNDGATFTDGGVTWMNVTGEGTYGWSVAAGSIYSLAGYNLSVPRGSVGDRYFISSDHVDTATSQTTWSPGGYGLVRFISVNRAGNVPPGPGDIQNGAFINQTGGSLTFESNCNVFWQGFTFNAAGNIYFVNTGQKGFYFKNCVLALTGTTSGFRIQTQGTCKIVFDNCICQFANVGQGFVVNGATDLTWINTTSAIQGSVIPTTLFLNISGQQWVATCRGVDLSAITTSLATWSGSCFYKLLFDSCKIAPGVTRIGGTPSFSADEVELVNCFDGTNTINERYTPAGIITTDRTTYLTTGAQDDIANYSMRMSSSARSDFATMSLDCFAFDMENVQVGSTYIATVEIVSGVTLNTNDVRLFLEYMGTTSSPVVSFGDNLASVLTTGIVLPSSGNTWTGITGPFVIWNIVESLNVALSNNNLTASPLGSATQGGIRAFTIPSSGKFYFELTGSNWSNGNTSAGIGFSGFSFTTALGSQAGTAVIRQTGAVFINGVSAGVSLSSPGNSVTGIAVDLTNSLIWFRNAPSGNWNNSGTANPATGTGGLSISAITTGALAPIFQYNASSEVCAANFGQTAFSGAVPSGFASGFMTASKQLLQVTFTPQRAGRIRGLVRLGKPSTTCWVNPQISLTAYTATNRALSSSRAGLGSVVFTPGAANAQLVSNVGVSNG